MNVRDLCNNILKKVCTKEGLEAEVYLIERKSTNIVISQKKIEDCKVSHNKGVGLRILSDNRWGSAYTTSFDSKDIDAMVGMAWMNLSHTTADQHNKLPAHEKGLGRDLDDLMIYDASLVGISLDEKMKQVLLMEEKTLAFDSKVKNVPHAAYSDSEFTVNIINSLGVDASYCGTGCSIGVVALAMGNEQTQTGSEFSARRFYKDLDVGKMAQSAAWRAVSMLGAQPVKTKRTTILFDPLVAGEFLSLIASGVCADSVQRGKSLFKGKVGKRIASKLVSIQDDGILSGGISTAFCDDEGVLSQKKTVVKDGVLQGYLYDTYSASRDNTKSTGNAVRGSFKDSPGVGTTNFFIEKGEKSKEDIITDTKEGFYVIEVMGMHMADPISGDFSVGASGLWIRKGEFTVPVQGVTIAGNIIDLLNSIDGVGSDLMFYGGIGSPTLRIQDIMIGGM
ncbi:MAG: TldD/PmbA family protein [bacterium]